MDRAVFVEHVKGLARSGFKVFPTNNLKRPTTEGWQELATDDEEMVGPLFSEHMNGWLGVGVRTGLGFIVIDTDPKNCGEENLIKMEKNLGALPPTLTSRSGSGGHHRYYKVPENIEITNRAPINPDYPGVDVRGRGGYVVAPPSMHESGNSYEWLSVCDTMSSLPVTWVASLSVRPREIAKAQPKGQKKEMSVDTLRFLAEGAADGERNHRLFKAAADMCGCGYDQSEAESRLVDACSKCRPPYPEKEALKTIDSAFKGERIPANPKAKDVSGQKPAADSGSKREFVAHKLADVSMRRLEWLWRPRFPLGKLSLLLGDPGLGKSLVTIDMASRVSRGAPWHDDPTNYQEPGNVLIISGEDDIEDTIKPRLVAAGANVDRIFCGNTIRGADGNLRQWSLADLDTLEDMCRKINGLRLIILDPIGAYFGEADSYHYSETQGALLPLVNFAAEQRASIVGIMHMNKSSGAKGIYRAVGSIGIPAVSRAAWAVLKDKNCPERRFVLPVKGNLGPEATGMAYRVEQVEVDGVNPQPQLLWDTEPITESVDTILHRENLMSPSDRDNGRAEDFIRDILSDGHLSLIQINKMAADAGLSRRATKDALEKVAHSFKIGYRSQQKHFWALGKDTTNDPTE